MPDEKTKEVEWETFEVGLTVPTDVQFATIRFTISGRAKNRKAFIKAAAPEIKDAINEIASECGFAPVFTE